MKIAIIPARGGSKRILKKNIKPFFNKPIISYSIKVAIESGLYDEIMVSTDNDEIASIAKSYGAKVPFLRSKKNSSDFASTADVLIEVLNYYKEKDAEFKTGTCIYPCAPLLNAKILIDSFKIIKNQSINCVFPVIPFSHPIERSIKLSKENKIISFISDNSVQRTQDFRDSYYDAGMFYTFNVKKLLLNKTLITENTYAIKTSELLAQDIDNESDWKLAEMKYKLFLNDKL